RHLLGVARVRSLRRGLARCRGGASLELGNVVWASFECGARPAVIPRLHAAGNGADELPGSQQVIGDIRRKPRQPALQSNDATHRPTLEHLCRGLDPRNGVPRRESKAMPDVEIGISVVSTNVIRVDGIRLLVRGIAGNYVQAM